MSDIFISYKREDENTARILAASLHVVGWSVWWDPQLRAGEHYDEIIERELGNAKCIIVLWSQRSIGSQYVKDEATYALNHRKLIPVTIEDVSLPFRFKGLHTLSLHKWDGSQDTPVFRKLLADIDNIVGASLGEDVSPKATSCTGPRLAHPVSIASSSVAQAESTDAESDEGESESILGVTAIYGQAFTETQVRDIYKLKVYVNLLGRASDADGRAKKEIQNFLAKQGYGAYEIVDRRRNLLRGYYEYTIRFTGK